MKNDASVATRGAKSQTIEHAVSAELRSDCPFSIAQEYTADFFKLAERGGEQAEIRVPIHVFGMAFHRRVAVSFGIHLDETENGRAHDRIQVRWSAGTPFMPNFHGSVRFRIDGSATRVLVDGFYRAPFGMLGGIFDRFIGSRIARSSINDLTSRIARYLEVRQREWRAGFV